MSDLAERADVLRVRLAGELAEFEKRVEQLEGAVERARNDYDRTGHPRDSAHLGRMESERRDTVGRVEVATNYLKVFDELLEAAKLREEPVPPGVRRVDAGRDEHAHSEAFCEWLRDHGVEPEITYRIDISAGSMVVWQWHSVEGVGKHIRARCPVLHPVRRPGVSDEASQLLISDDEAGPCRRAPRVVEIQCENPYAP